MIFFENGVYEKGFVFGTDAKIPRGIPIEDMNKLRQNVRLIDVTDEISDKNNSEEYARIIKKLTQELEKKEPYEEPKLYPGIVFIFGKVIKTLILIF